MIHDAQVEVTCDCDGCTENQFIPLDYVPMHGYSNTDAEIERRLGNEDWVVKDGKHYCCEGHLP